MPKELIVVMRLALGLLAWLWNLANTNFGIGLIAAVMGSFAGAYGAQWIAEREGSVRRGLEQQRRINTSIVLAISLVNVIVALKRQHIHSLVTTYRASRTQLDAMLADEPPQDGQPYTFAFVADYQTITLPQTPISILTNLVYSDINASGHIIALTSLLGGVAEHLDRTLQERNVLIDELRHREDQDGWARAEVYFGLPNGHGGTDQRYPGLINGLESYTNDSLVFGLLLADQLMRHGDSVAKQIGKRAIKVAKGDFKNLFATGLVPAWSSYEDVLNGLGIKPSDTTLAANLPNWAAQLPEVAEPAV